MEVVEFQALVDQLSGLTAGQREALIEAVRAKASASDAVSLVDRRFAAAPRCPHCRSVAVGTWSRPRPLTRYKCHGCRRTFTGLTGTPLERLRRRDAWLDYAQALADGEQRKATAVSGMVEVDETYFLRSQRAGARSPAGKPASAEDKLQDLASRTSTQRC